MEQKTNRFYRVVLFVLMLFAIIGCVAQKGAISVIEESQITSNGVILFSIKNNSLSDIFIIENISNGFHESILNKEVKLTNFILFSNIIGKEDTTFYYPAIESFNLLPQYKKIDKKSTSLIKLNLNSFYDWQKFSNVDHQFDIKGRLQIFYIINKEIESEYIYFDVISVPR